MAPVSSETANTKMSYSKVVASAYMPQIKKSNATTPAATQLPATPTIQTNSSSVLLKKPNDIQPRTNDGQSPLTPDGATTPAGIRLTDATPSTQPNHPAPVTGVSGDDNATLLSSSDSSNKPASVDGKSTTSGTTFAMDEKESIRPDDSASIRAAPDEEDFLSAPGSRVGSEAGAHAFRDQLQKLTALGAGGPLPQRGIPIMPAQPFSLQTPPATIQNGRNGDVLQPTPMPLAQAAAAGMVPMPPDEKLIDALQSPKDRLWVLKLEQDVLDFMKNDQETMLALPQCNAFYRMLAHKLADYYFLRHSVDNTYTAVHLIKMPSSRIPPPLSGLAVSSTTSITPPPLVPTRKIMRRGEAMDGSGTNTGFNSENPSKATSEAGESGNEADKKKGPLTREEREVRYNEARRRLFGDSENTMVEAENKEDGKETSRSSSATGKKKTKQKQRNYDNDGFEARSQFNPYYGQQYALNGFAADGTYYPAYSNMAPAPYTGIMMPGVSPPMYGAPFPQISPQDPQGQFVWPQGQLYPGMVPAMNGGAPANGFDLSAQFNQGMQSFQNAPTMPQQATPKMMTPSMAYPAEFRPQSQQSNQSWNPMLGYDTSYQIPAQFTPNLNDSRPVSASGQLSQTPQPVPYPYGQLPSFHQGSPNRNPNHPVPGSFAGRQQFNPQSQTFVPGGMQANRMQQMPQMSYQSNPPNLNGYASNSPNLSAYGTFSVVSPQPTRQSPPQQTFSARPGQPHSQNSSQGTNATTPQQTMRLPSQTQPQRSPHPLPPNPLNVNGDGGSSIAKWGTPNLPAKPPPPVSMDLPEKFYEANGNMPAHAFSGMPSLYPPNHANGVNKVNGQGK